MVVRIAADITRVIHKEPASALARNSRVEEDQAPQYPPIIIVRGTIPNRKG